MTNDISQKISQIITADKIVLFMKGEKDHPQCGFSKQVVQILNGLVADYKTVDVLQDPEIRQGIKDYSSWPTIPQLYVNKEFIGGCDIIHELFNKGELAKILGVKPATTAPEITVSAAATEAFIHALKEAPEGETIRISIGADFEHGLHFDKKLAEDFVVKCGDVDIIIDPYSANRAAGLVLDFVQGELESGFTFTNPNEPPEVKELSVEELKEWHDSKKDSLLIDVRPKSEWEQAHISFAKLLEDFTEDQFAQLKKDHAIVFQCHHGGRSRRVAESFRKKGFTNIYNLSGGIDAWSRKIDSNVPIY